MRSSSPRRRFLRFIFPLAVYTGLIAAFFWPLIWHAVTGLHDRSDTTLNTWIVNWQAHILVRDPLALFRAPIFYPLTHSLALSEILWPAAPLAVPLLTAGQNPVLVYNLLFLFNFLLAGLGAYLLALRWTASRAAALLAGIIYAFSPHQFGHLSQLQLLSIGWLPLCLLFLDRYWMARRPRDGFLLAFTLAAQALSAFYYAFQVVLAVGLYIVWRLILAPSRRSLPILARTVAWAALGGLFILPFTVPYFQVRAGLGLQRSLAETLSYAPPLTDYLLPRPDNPLYAPFLRLWHNLPAGGGLFLGIAPVVLALLGLFVAQPTSPSLRGKGAWGLGRLLPSLPRGGSALRDKVRGEVLYWPLLMLSAGILSLGPQLKLTPSDPGGLPLPFGWLYQHVPGLTAIRAPGRFGVSVFLALALLAALGAAWLFRRIRQPAFRGMVCAALAAICLAEYAAGLGPIGMLPMPSLSLAPPVYAWLAAQPAAPIVELPLTSDMATPPAIGENATTAAPASDAAGSDAAWPDYNVMRYQYFGLIHWQASIDGYSGFTPPHHRELGLTMADFPSERALALLRGLGVRRVIVHRQLMDAFQPGRAAQLRAALAHTPGVRHEADFGDDWVYAIEPIATQPSVQGRFWTDHAGEAYLILQATGPGSAVFSPLQRLQVTGSWQTAPGGKPSPFTQSVGLPLLVSETSVVRIPLPGDPTGPYTLTLAAPGAPFAVDAYTVHIDRAAALAEAGTLLPVALDAGGLPARATPGASLDIALRWRLLDRPASDYSVSVRAQDAAGHVISQDDRPLSGGRDLVRAWQPGMSMTTTHHLTLPAGATGRDTLQVFLYRPGDPATYLFFNPKDGTIGPVSGDILPAVRGPLLVKSANFARVSLPPPAPLARFAGDVYLLSANVQPPKQAGEPFTLVTTWVTASPLPADYTLFAHLVSPTGDILAQQDHQPGGNNPTGVWEPGELVTDTLQITSPATSAGQTACLRLGLYDATLKRLPRADGAATNGAVTDGAATPDYWQGADCWQMPPAGQR
jgi:hypothetical protein